MDLNVLPVRTRGAAENMAVDFLLLQRWPGAAVPRFRHYEWRAPAFTFGYGQKIAFIRGELPVTDGIRLEVTRRATGGGLVDHRNDWTYALVIPRGHPLEEVRATESYRIVHAAIAGSLVMQGVEARLATAESQAQPARPEVALHLVCFEHAEVHDVIGKGGAKIAGAAQKRTKHGLLFQGSISRSAAGADVDWDRFEQHFTDLLARQLGGNAVPTPWPDFDADEVDGLTEQYGAPEWIEAR